MKWVKKVPSKDGLYWSHWKGKSGWRMTVATVTHLRESVHVHVDGAGMPFVARKSQREEIARKVLGYKELKFWTTAITPPSPPKKR